MATKAENRNLSRKELDIIWNEFMQISHKISCINFELNYISHMELDNAMPKEIDWHFIQDKVKYSMPLTQKERNLIS